MKITKQAYTAEFKERAVKRVKEGQSIRAVVKELGLGDQILRHGIKASAEGQINGVGAEWSRRTRGNCPRLRAENLRLKRAACKTHTVGMIFSLRKAKGGRRAAISGMIGFSRPTS